MTDAELVELLSDLESDRVERKESVSDPDRIRQAICAFANDLPGHRQAGAIFVGVRDDGTCAGTPITDALLRQLADMRSDGNTVPFPAMTVQKRTLRGCEVAVVEVEPADAPPVRMRGRVWVRVGPRRAVASQQEEQRLAEKRRSRDLPFELHPIRSASTADFDLDLFLRTYLPSAIDADTLAENGRTVEQQLTSLRFLSAGAEPAPTVLGILTIGRDPTAFLPGAYVQFVRYDGPDLSDPVIDSAVVAGPLPDLLSALEQRISGHLHVGMDLDARKHAARPDYPVAALRQIVRNAILHRTYEGTAAPVRVYWFAARIEVHSPGGPFGIVTVENFGRPGVTDYRNPYLAEAMRNLGYVEKFGVGLAIARRELAANGNPPPEFEVNPSHVVAVVRRRA